MAQEENYIAIVSQRLSRPGDIRYVIIDKQTQQEVDNCNGRGYKSPQSAHKSFSFKMRQRGRSARRVPMNGHARDLVSPFVQEASADCQRPMVVRDDGAPQVTRVNTWAGYAPRRASSSIQAQSQSFARPQRRPKDVSQENTLPPPDLFDYNK